MQIRIPKIKERSCISVMLNGWDSCIPGNSFHSFSEVNMGGSSGVLFFIPSFSPILEGHPNKFYN